MTRAARPLGITATQESVTHTMAAIRRLARYLTPYWPVFSLLLLLVLVSAGVAALGPLLIGQAIDQFIVPGDRAGLGRTLLVLLGVFGLGVISSGAQLYIMGRVGQRILAHVRQEIFHKIQALSLGYFDTHEAGDLMSRLTNDVDTLNQSLSQGLVQVVGGLLQMVGIGIAMLSLQWQLGLAAFLVLPLMVLTTKAISWRAQIAFRQSREVLGAVLVELEEGITSVKEAQAFNRVETNLEAFAEVNDANLAANVRAGGIMSSLAPTLGVYNALAVAIVAGMGGFLTLRGAMSVGLVVSYLRYVQQFFGPVQQLSQFWGQTQSALAGAHRIFTLLDEPEQVTDRADAWPMPPLAGAVTFDHVSFAYNPSEPVLHNINLTAQPGQIIALVGATGSGKTTVVNLLPRFYDVSDGRVLIDGTDVREVTQASLRQQIGMVLQEPFLFASTVADNIRYGRLEATDTEVEAAARMVHVHDFIMQLPDGYQTQLGERGSTFSQGQRQLISLARAVLANPRILILDEATANIDTRTEALIQQALQTLLAGRTSFVIAHRLGTIVQAHQIVVLERGRIVEQAVSTPERSAHAALLDKGGAYASLYTRQFRQQASA